MVSSFIGTNEIISSFFIHILLQLIVHYHLFKGQKADFRRSD